MHRGKPLSANTPGRHLAVPEPTLMALKDAQY